MLNAITPGDAIVFRLTNDNLVVGKVFDLSAGGLHMQTAFLYDGALIGPYVPHKGPVFFPAAHIMALALADNELAANILTLP